MRILVTGGTGFIGNHLCRKLLSQGHTVVCLDNNYTGSLDNIEDLMTHCHFEWIDHDVVNSLGFSDMQLDQIYHLACPASPKAYQSDPIKTIQTNVIGTMNMLDLSQATNARILFTSTSEVYGDAQIHPQHEEYWGNVNPVGIRSCYDEGKRIAETLCMEYHRQRAVDIRIARIFNTYGPRMHPGDGRVVSNFIVQCLRDEPITIYGDGSQTRSFCYVDDTVDALISLMNQPKTIGPINVGNPDEITVSTLAEKVIQCIPDTKSAIVYMHLPQDDPRQRRPDITKARDDLNWCPRITMEEGLRKTIDWFQTIEQR